MPKQSPSITRRHRPRRGLLQPAQNAGLPQEQGMMSQRHETLRFGLKFGQMVSPVLFAADFADYTDFSCTFRENPHNPRRKNRLSGFMSDLQKT